MHCCQKQARDILNERCSLSFEQKKTCHWKAFACTHFYSLNQNNLMQSYACQI